MVYYVFAIIIALLGLSMVVFPKFSTKAEKRDDPKAVKGTRIRGVFTIVIGIAVALLAGLM